MIVDACGRQGGKTYRLVQWVREAPEDEHRVIIVPTAYDARALMEQYGVGRESVCGVARADSLRGLRNVVLGVDNVEQILGDLHRITGFRIARITITPTEVEV